MKKFLSLFLALAMVLSLASFSLAEEKVTVRAWVCDGAETVVYTEIFDDFNAKNAGIVVDYQFFAQDELLNKLQTAPVVGDTPDIVVIDGLQIPYFQDLGMIACIDEYLSDELRADMLQSAKDECTYDGKLYGVAQFDSGLSFWADKAALEKIGARIPVSYKEAWNQEEFEKVLADLKAAGYEYPLYIRQNSPKSLYFTYIPFVKAFGGDFLNRDTMTAVGALDSEGTIAAYDYMKKLIDEGYINPTCDYEDAFFGRKEAAISLIGHWKYTDHVNAFGDNAILVPLPDFGNGVWTSSGSTVDVMTTAAVERGVGEQAWAVLEALMSEEYIKKVVGVNGAVPARSSILATMEEYQEGGRLYLYREQLDAGLSFLRPVTAAHSTVYDAVKTVVINILAGADPADELQYAAEYCDEIIIENGWNIE